MSMREIINSIAAKHSDTGIQLYPPVSAKDIGRFERQIGFSLPEDFKEFYSICNGFLCEEDLFQMIPLQDLLSNDNFGKDWFWFSECMIFCDAWTLKKVSDNYYEILDSLNNVLTTSLEEFLIRFLKGDVFETGGLNDWSGQPK
jgi:hypothetical protein